VAEDNDPSSRTEEATPRRLEEARRRGDVPKSADLPAFAALAAAAGAVAMAGGGAARSISQALVPFIAHPDAISLQGGGAVQVGRAALMASAPAIVMVMGAAAAAGVFGNLVQHGFLWSPAKLKPQLDKLNPMAGFGRIFGIDGLVQFGKSLGKIGVVAAVAFLVLKPRSAQLSGLSALDPSAILPLTAAALKALVFAVVTVMGLGAVIDWLWQRHRFLQRMRMSKEELKEDFRQSEGDPHVKGKLKQMRVARSKQRMMQAVPKATVVVMNPTHYAVALRYEQGETAAPVCVAKGLDSLALRIRQIAEDNKVEVIEDPPLARALYAAVEVDEAIPQDHYRAVAKIIGFVLGKARKKVARPLL
jgi:flagellar biosynthetic protein FlhB